MKEIAIVGAGLTGPLLALLLARRGNRVHLFEQRPDPRAFGAAGGKSVNITLCMRGFAALARAGVDSAIQGICVPAHGRLIHALDGSTELQPYGNTGEALYSVPRHSLNCMLLEFVEAAQAAEVHFGTQCVGLELTTNTLTLRDEKGSLRRQRFDHVIGADGTRSVVRQHLQNRSGFNFSQRFSEHGNRELAIPSTGRAPWLRERNALHIWPRGDFMLIAFPNADGSFTSTLHMPLEGDVSFASISSEDALLKLFRVHFPDALGAMPDLVSNYFANPTIPMVTVRCSPWRVADKVLLIGDAAHAVWPAYGQGANAGFEDCLALDESLDRCDDDWALATADYERRRKPDVEAVADLSESHFNEIRRLVGQRDFLLRKRVERKLNQIFPLDCVPLYCLVAFTRTPYAQAVLREERNKRLVDAILALPNIERTLDTPHVEAWIRRLPAAMDEVRVMGRYYAYAR